MILAATLKFKWTLNYNEMLPISAELMNRESPMFLGVTVLNGLILVSIPLVFPWIALEG